ncbi:AIG2-like protein [Neolecta irregularis DAH-3]|uniref:Putative gamma-glutamylcyclotransferase n=1 Tax=Neolecta irregularis (strain DAH-3) TaxID=1198029 RepID=A0A1U7LUN9_NEOID|nr:AIG2-like protein [Neolecta irregularis DAH-3]|eukprot:OLL26339.1 AIG2-like protein [Neolecta irregularis DAH-3]
MTQSVFVYGTLMHPVILERVIASKQKVLEPAVLKDYFRFCVSQTDYPAVIAETGQQVEGILIKNLNNKELERLDLFEGDEYQRISVNILMKSKEIVKGHVYVWIAVSLNYMKHISQKGKDRLLREPWHLEEFSQQKLHAWIASPIEFAAIDGLDESSNCGSHFGRALKLDDASSCGSRSAP